MDSSLEFYKSMAHSGIHNYVVPGVSSYLIGGTPQGGEGCVRLFHCERDQQEAVTPHSHRFNFHCVVLKGQVVNRVWRRAFGSNVYKADTYTKSIQRPASVPWEYDVKPVETNYYFYEDEVYEEGDEYGMVFDEIHSIFFKRDTWVLFFEGPEVTEESIILEPYVYSDSVWAHKFTTLYTTDQMFIKEE